MMSTKKGNKEVVGFDRAARPVYDRKASEADPDRQRRRFRALVLYDGTAFVGWQTQSNGNGVQDVLEHRLSIIFDSRVYVAGSGRTDAGVHARGQVIHFEVPEKAGPKAPAHLAKALTLGSDEEVAQVLMRTIRADAWRANGVTRNHSLPADIHFSRVSPAPEGFHARDSCIGKRYVYTIQEGMGSPMTARYRWTLGDGKKLNVERMNEAAQRLIGSHDFSTFGVREPGDPRPPVKRMRRIEVGRRVESDPLASNALGSGTVIPPWTSNDSDVDSIITICAECDRFLYNMMRMIAGTLVDVGLGRLSPDDVTSLLDMRGRKGGRAARGLEVTRAPSHGLCLHHCFYEPEETNNGWMANVDGR